MSLLDDNRNKRPVKAPYSKARRFLIWFFIIILIGAVAALWLAQHPDGLSAFGIGEGTSSAEYGEIPYQAFSPDDLPVYDGVPYCVVNDNKPFFLDELGESASLLSTYTSYEAYGELDALGRCTAARACLGTDLMPEEERESIRDIRPTGWHSVKYPGIDREYLYNRCHLIAFILAGENSNEKNLITGTRYLNTEGMEPFEKEVMSCLYRTSRHVEYRVTPIFIGKELVARGVLMEAYSLEDKGRGICFCVYCYNVQPGITIDYATGESEGPT